MRRVGRYQLTHRLAEGAFGEVYVARQLGDGGFDRPVAVKQLRSDRAGSPQALRRFQHEALLGASLQHANIVGVLDFVRGERDSHYLVMELVRGIDLRRLIDGLATRGLALPARLVALIGIEVCKGLAFAHGQVDAGGEPLGIVHRDLKPANLILSADGAIKILDFGIAESRLKQHQTRGGGTPGTLSYMTEDRLRGQAATCRDDVFSVGSILFELATGEVLFDGVRPGVTALNTLAGDGLEAFSKLRAVSSGLGDVVRDTVATPGKGAVRSANELLARLRSFLGRLPGDESLADLAALILADPPTPSHPSAEWTAFAEAVTGSAAGLGNVAAPTPLYDRTTLASRDAPVEELRRDLPARPNRILTALLGISVGVAGVVGAGSFLRGAPEGGMDKVDPSADLHPATGALPQPDLTSESEAVHLDAPLDGLVSPMVRIPASTFAMGMTDSNDTYGMRGGLHWEEVRIGADLLVATTETTQAQWAEVMDYNPSYFDWDDRRPVECVTFQEVASYLNRLSEAADLEPCYQVGCDIAPLAEQRCADTDNAQDRPVAHKYLTAGRPLAEECPVLMAAAPAECSGFRLPFEQEWEYIARAGSTSSTPWGTLTFQVDENGKETATPRAVVDFLGGQPVEVGGFDDLAVHHSNAAVEVPGGKRAARCHDPHRMTVRSEGDWCGSHPVATKKPSRWGLYDVLGNVAELTMSLETDPVQKPWSNDPLSAPARNFRDPSIPLIARGGSWWKNSRRARVSIRLTANRGVAYSTVGFRVVRTAR